MKDKIYPAFYRSADGYDYLYLDAANYYSFANAIWRKADGTDASEHEDDINITNEYLANTYGEVQSPEHAEFIIELAKSGGFKVWGLKRIDEIKTFAFENGELCLPSFHHEGLDSRKLKQITIPLPPKADKQESSEWPQIGDEVLIYNIEPDSRVIDFNNEKVKVIAKTKDDRGTVLTITHPSQGIGAIMFISNHVKKPKTPEGELRDDLFNCKKPNLDTLQAEDLSRWLIANYDIKKKPQ